MIGVTALSQLLNDRMPVDWNADRLVTEAEQKLGRSVDRSTVFRMLKGDHADNPRRATLEVFAATLDVSLEEMRAALNRPPLGEPFLLPEQAALLTPKQRRAVTAIVNAMLAPNDTADTAAPDTGATIHPLPQRSGSEHELQRDAAYAPGEPTAEEVRQREEAAAEAAEAAEQRRLQDEADDGGA